MCCGSLRPPDKTRLTIVVDGEGHIGSDDVIEADLTVLWGTVSVQGFHTHDPVEQTPLWDRSLVAAFDEHRGELIDVIHANVHGGPGGRRSGRRDTSRAIKPTTGRRQTETVLAARTSPLTTKQKGRSSLVGLLAVRSVGSLSAVVRLDGEAVLPLILTVQWLFGADQTLASGAVQHHGFKLDGP